MHDSVKLQIRRLEHYGIGVWGVIIASTLIVEGYIGYYEIPNLLVSNNVERFLFFANVILVILVIGCSLLLSEALGPCH